MKNIIIGTVITLIFTACSDEHKSNLKESSKLEDRYGISWAKNLKTAFELAKESKKNVMVMAQSVNCKWCKKMKQRTLCDKTVSKRLEKYILVKVDKNIPNQIEELPPFKHVPIIFFMTPQKEIIDNMRGYYTADDFLEYLNAIEKS